MAENNNEVAKVAINDIGTEEDFIKAVKKQILCSMERYHSGRI